MSVFTRHTTAGVSVFTRHTTAGVSVLHDTQPLRCLLYTTHNRRGVCFYTTHNRRGVCFYTTHNRWSVCFTRHTATEVPALHDTQPLGCVLHDTKSLGCLFYTIHNRWGVRFTQHTVGIYFTRRTSAELYIARHPHLLPCTPYKIHT